jgi:hypothetical protein
MKKSNVTLWKNREASNDRKNLRTKSNQVNTSSNKNPQSSSNVESEFISNLKKQIYFMEMELKLMKEREREISKSGGFTQLFNDDRDPSIHIQQMKTKYANMRKKMENEIAILNDKKRDILGINVSLKAKLNTLQKLELDTYNKLKDLETNKKNELNHEKQSLEEKDNEKINTEADNRLQNTKLKAEINNNEELDYKIKTDDEISKMSQNDFDNEIKLIEDLVQIKGEELSQTREKMNEMTQKAESVPNYKEEYEKNEEYKQQILELKDKALKLTTDAEIAEMANNYIIKKKNDVVEERRKYIDLNVELRNEIKAKNTLNDQRIQKKVREANSEEIQEIKSKLEETNKKVDDLEKKINNENEKKQNFTKEIIKANIKLEHKKEEESDLQKKIEKLKEELEEKKKNFDNLENESDELKDKIGKEKTDNELLRNRNKLLHEEYEASIAKYDFITNNYDFTTNLKRISMEDLKNLEQSNNLVNTTIGNFVDKVGTFKKNNIQNLLFDETM